MKLFEYIGAGLPVVAPALPNVSEVIADGETGLLFPPGDARGMADRVGQLIQNPGLRRRLGENARREVLCKYTWRKYAERFTELAEEVLEAHRASPSR